MTKTWKSQLKVSYIGLVNLSTFSASWRISKTDEWREKQQVSEHTKKPISSANWIFCIMNIWWDRRTKDTTEIDENPLKPDKWSEKVQGSRYDWNDEITVIQNDEKLKMYLKSLSDWPSKSQCILCILMNHRKLNEWRENNKSENSPKKSPSWANGISDTKQTPETSNNEMNHGNH